jgi:hypothetical protein
MEARPWERPVAVEGVREGKPAGHRRCRVVLHVRFMRRERGDYEIAEKGLCALGAVYPLFAKLPIGGPAGCSPVVPKARMIFSAIS